MAYLNWMGEHPFLTVFLTLAVCITVETVTVNTLKVVAYVLTPRPKGGEDKESE